MQIPIYQIDAFSNEIFKGNPAAVCPLDSWLDDVTLQRISQENNLSETAYFTKEDETTFNLRWFTPEYEIDLCGHATLATAHVILNEHNYKGDTVNFKTLSGLISVKKEDDFLILNLPCRPSKVSELPKIIEDSLNIQPQEIYKARDYLLVYSSEDDVKAIHPNIVLLNQINLNPGGIIITAPSNDNDIDFVTRFFTPQATIFEDPATGSAQCTLVPYWANRLNKTTLYAFQHSQRTAKFKSSIANDRVIVKGQAVTYLKGEIYLPF
jgi:PhzF family phenazine biosynthesis protein